MVTEDIAERSRRVAAIKRAAKSTNNGRSYLLPGLWVCRLAAGLTQRQLAEAIGGTQSTVRELERQERGAYPGTIGRLCRAFGVLPEDLLRGGGTEQQQEGSIDGAASPRTPTRIAFEKQSREERP